MGQVQPQLLDITFRGYEVMPAATAILQLDVNLLQSERMLLVRYTHEDGKMLLSVLLSSITLECTAVDKANLSTGQSSRCKSQASPRRIHSCYML
jgi:hypothetical protein